MKMILMIAAAFLINANSSAQDRWSVVLNSKTVLTANQEDTLKNVVKLDDLKKGSLIVTYHPGKVEGERKRRIMIFDLNDRELYSKEEHSISVPVARLKEWMVASPWLKVYTIPVLGEEGANIKLRRMHLATILLE